MYHLTEILNSEIRIENIPFQPHSKKAADPYHKRTRPRGHNSQSVHYKPIPLDNSLQQCLDIQQQGQTHN